MADDAVNRVAAIMASIDVWRSVLFGILGGEYLGMLMRKGRNSCLCGD